MSDLSLRKRKVRKGTRSCWECRRRKIKCRFQQPDDSTCINCREHDTSCVSQRFAAEPNHAGPPAATPALPDATGNQMLTERLAQLEKLLQDVLKAKQGASTVPRDAESSLAHPTESTVDLLDSSAVSHAHNIAAAISSPGIFHTSSPDSASLASLDSITTNTTISISEPSPECVVNNYYLLAHEDGARKRSRQLSRDLFAVLPSAHMRNILAHESTGASLVLNYFQTREDQIAGRAEPPWSFASATWPAVDTHPVLIAKRLLQYSICMQQLPPKFDPARLQLPAGQQPCEPLGTWVGAATALLAGNDELVGCIEGIEALMLLSMFQSDAGHLRKAWVTTRRALTLGQLMGMNRSSPPTLRSCAASTDPQSTPSVSLLWYRILSSDRYHSLILGLPLGSQKDNFSHGDSSTEDTLGRLCKDQTVLFRQVADRNDMDPGANETCSFTQSIDDRLQSASDYMSTSWWTTPDLAEAVRGSNSQGGLHRLMTTRNALNLQVRHFMLSIFLHLPYLLAKVGHQHEHSRTACMGASRAVLERFLVYRKEYLWHGAGRQVDYSALISAMTLCLSYLGPSASDQKRADRELVENVLLKFRELGAYKRDRLSLESAETINHLLPILTTDMSKTNNSVKINVPFLGTVIIAPRAPNHEPAVHSTPAIAPELHRTLQVEPSNSFPYPNQNMFDWTTISLDSTSPQLDDWTFQGIDTTYWSTLNQNFI